MSGRTDAAREAARDRSSGRFGEQYLADPGGCVLCPPPAWWADYRGENLMAFGPRERYQRIVELLPRYTGENIGQAFGTADTAAWERIAGEEWDDYDRFERDPRMLSFASHFTAVDEDFPYLQVRGPMDGSSPQRAGSAVIELESRTFVIDPDGESYQGKFVTVTPQFWVVGVDPATGKKLNSSDASNLSQRAEILHVESQDLLYQADEVERWAAEEDLTGADLRLAERDAARKRNRAAEIRAEAAALVSWSVEQQIVYRWHACLPTGPNQDVAGWLTCDETELLAPSTSEGDAVTAMRTAASNFQWSDASLADHLRDNPIARTNMHKRDDA